MPLPIPKDYLCPMTQKIMLEPVTLSDGQTYERDAIEKWLATHDTHPLTGAKLESKAIVPNLLVKKLITAFIEQHKKTLEAEILTAAQNGANELIKSLLKMGISIETSDAEGRTVLYTAVKANQENTVLFLVENGADIEAKNNYGYTPLHLAAHNGYTNMINILLDKGACLEEKNKDGYSPLHSAISRDRKSAVALLLERGANYKSKILMKKDSTTPKIQEAFNALELAIAEDNTDMAQLIEHKILAIKKQKQLKLIEMEQTIQHQQQRIAALEDKLTEVLSLFTVKEPSYTTPAVPKVGLFS